MQKGQVSSNVILILGGIVVLFLIGMFVFKAPFLPCQTGDTKTVSCQDGSLRVSHTCFNNQWMQNVVDCTTNPGYDTPTPYPTIQSRGCAWNEPSCPIGYACSNNICVYVPTPTPGSADCRTTGCSGVGQICIPRDFGQGAVYLCQSTSSSGDCRTVPCATGQYCDKYCPTCSNYVCKTSIQLYPSPSPTVIVSTATPTPTSQPLVKNQACTTELGSAGHFSGLYCISDSASKWGYNCIYDGMCADLGGGARTTCQSFACKFP